MSDYHEIISDTHLEYLQDVRGDDHLDRGPIVRRRELQLLVVGFNTKLVGTVSPASPSLVLQDVGLD